MPALLQAVQYDAVTAVREEAAETLVEYAARPQVLATIQQLLRSEQDEGVRRHLEEAVRDAAKKR